MNMYKQYHKGTFYWENNGGTDYDGDTGQTGNVKFKASRGQVNADGTTYKTEAESVFKDGGIVRPNAYITRIWKRVN